MSTCTHARRNEILEIWLKFFKSCHQTAACSVRCKFHPHRTLYLKKNTTDKNVVNSLYFYNVLRPVLLTIVR